MKRTFIAIALLSLLTLMSGCDGGGGGGSSETSFAKDEKKELTMENYPKYVEERFALTRLGNSILNSPENRKEVEFIYRMLANTSEKHMHRMNGALENKVYLHKEGHEEAVYDGKGELIEDCANMGSFNYHHPYKAPLKHFTFDSLPWMEWGNCKEDPTTREQRVEAYLKDLREGIEKTLTENKSFDKLSVAEFDSDGEQQAVWFFLKVTRSSPDIKLADVVTAMDRGRYDEVDAFIDNMEKGFREVFKEPDK